jgi:hypothetical protein
VPRNGKSTVEEELEWIWKETIVILICLEGLRKTTLSIFYLRAGTLKRSPYQIPLKILYVLVYVRK